MTFAPPHRFVMHRQPASGRRFRKRLLVGLLMLCVMLQGLAVGTRRALGPGHLHRQAVGAAAGGIARAAAALLVLRVQDSPQLPFDGRLRHDTPLRHGEHGDVQHHVHAPGTPGVVAVDNDDAGHKLARLLSLAQQALDLPAAVGAGMASAQIAVAPQWPGKGRTAFGSRGTEPLLRPPREG